MAPLLLLVLAGWGDFPERPVAPRGPPPRSSQRKEALEEFQGLLGQWQRERLDFTREQSLQQKAEGQLELSRAAPPEPDEPVKRTKAGPEVTRGRSGRGKVIELPQRDKLDAELEQAQAEAEARRLECAKDPSTCAAQRKKRRKTDAGNEAFEAAIDANFEKRRAQIEADAAKIQSELNAARTREANREAKKLGGTVDAEGNFADDDLKAEPPARKPD